MNDTIILAGDIGGTKTSLALFSRDAWPGPPLRRETYANRGADGVATLIDRFLAGTDLRPAAACLGVAGPVFGNRVQLTNLDWQIDGPALARRFALDRVLLVNDLVATAMGALLLDDASLWTINPGRPDPGATGCILAPGTGLGEAWVVRDQGRLLPRASEGGHAAFAPRDELQLELLRFMQQRRGHVSVEDVCSGRALPSLFDFLRQHEATPSWLEDELRAAADPTPVLVAAAVAAAGDGRDCAIAVATVRLFLDILAGEAANLALKTLALAGVHIGGGMAPRVLPLLDPERFMAIFSQGIYHEMLGRIPVWVVLDPDVALAGAASCGIAALRENP